jgi:hypothetical protein
MNSDAENVKKEKRQLDGILMVKRLYCSGGGAFGHVYDVVKRTGGIP